MNKNKIKLTKEDKYNIMEIARIALEDKQFCCLIKEELDITDEYVGFLSNKLNKLIPEDI